MSPPRSLLPALWTAWSLLLGCPSEAPPPPPACGDGAVLSPEVCDDGADNARSPDACRPDCTLPRCGDSITDPRGGETCDDGGGFGGDGCAPDCLLEALPGEAEPNDSTATATLLPEDGALVLGLPRRDVDCVAFKLPEDGWVSADVSDGDGACPADLLLRLVDPRGSVIAVGSPVGLGTSCSPIDPRVDEGARFAWGGVYSLCVEAFFVDDEVPSYVLTVERGSDSCALPELPFPSTQDLDDDGVPDRCDLDDDGDDVLDDVDNCPGVPNGPGAAPRAVDDQGFVRDWLLLGPLPDLPSDSACFPSTTEVLGDNASAAPSLGDAFFDAVFFAHFDRNRHLDFLDVMGGPTPREVLAAVYLWSEVARSATLAVGADDGVRGWLNGAVVLEIGSCQGVNPDQFTAEVALLAGWNRLLFQVRDQGGGWGLMARFLDAAAPIVDLEVSLTPGGSFAPTQADRDGDGLGDWCDPTPDGA